MPRSGCSCSHRNHCNEFRSLVDLFPRMGAPVVDPGDVFTDGGVVVRGTGEGTYEHGVRVDDPFDGGWFVYLGVHEAEEHLPVLQRHHFDCAVELWVLLPNGSTAVKGEHLGVDNERPFAHDAFPSLETSNSEHPKTTLPCLGYTILRRLWV